MPAVIPATAGALAFLDGLVSRTESYPAWAKAIFGATLVIVLAAAFVYLALYGAAEQRRQAVERATPDPEPDT